MEEDQTLDGVRVGMAVRRVWTDLHHVWRWDARRQRVSIRVNPLFRFHRLGSRCSLRSSVPLHLRQEKEKAIRKPFSQAPGRPTAHPPLLKSGWDGREQVSPCGSGCSMVFCRQPPLDSDLHEKTRFRLVNANGIDRAKDTETGLFSVGGAPVRSLHPSLAWETNHLANL